MLTGITIAKQNHYFRQLEQDICKFNESLARI
jgi:hypothetical protein